MKFKLKNTLKNNHIADYTKVGQELRELKISLRNLPECIETDKRIDRDIKGTKDRLRRFNGRNDIFFKIF